MKRFLTICSLLLSLALLTTAAWGQTTLATWTFETDLASGTGSVPTFSAGSTAESGILTVGSVVTGNHVSAATAWSSPAGNGSAKSLSSNNWAVGDYYQFTFSTVGYKDIEITWDQISSNTGPRDFIVQYSINGTSFTTVGGTFTILANATPNAWTATTPNTASRNNLPLEGITAINNYSTVYIRIVDNSTTSANGTTVAAGGTSRVDNFTVTSNGLVPVELSEFNAVGTRSGAMLNWKTATEKNNYGFNVERRTVGTTEWSKIAFVKGNGTSNNAHSYSYTDANVASGSYAYRISQIDNDGATKTYSESQVTVGAAAKAMSLGNYPNPFNPTTRFEFTVPNDGLTVVKVYNVLGQEVATVFNGEVKAGEYQHASFNGAKFASGVYFYTIENNGQKMVKKMLMMK